MKAPRAPYLKAALLPLFLLAPFAARAQEEPPQKAAANVETPAAAPAATPAPAARTLLTGRVLGESGEPVPDVSVALVPRTSAVRRGPEYTVASDESGGFRFESLDPGLYEVYAQLPGFVVETDSLTGRALGPYRPGDNVTVRLVRGGVVTGTVTDSQGQPLTALNVRAVRVRDLDGAQPANPFSVGGEDRTDDRGAYRIYGLRPGLYVVYAGGFLNAAFPLTAGSGEVATFYPSGTRDTAAEVMVRGGQEAGGIDIRMREDPGRRVTGTVELPAGSSGDPGFGVGVTLTYASTTMPAATTGISPNAAERSFSFDAIADGEYDLQASLAGREGLTLASAPQRVTVRGADVTGLRLVLAPLASASGDVRFEPAAEAGRPAPEACKSVRASQLPQETLITAAAAVPVRPKPGAFFSRLAFPHSATPDGSGSFTVRALDAGRYRLSVRLFDEALYVRSIQTPAPAATASPRAGAQRTPTAATSAALSRDLFDLKAGRQLTGLVVRVAEGAASFGGALAAAEPTAGAPPQPPPAFSQLRVHLVPQERERAEDTLRYYEAAVNADGSFSFKHLAPGRYLVLARPFFVEAGEREPRPAAFDANTRALLRREAESANVAVELRPCQRTTDYVLRFPPPTK